MSNLNQNGFSFLRLLPNGILVLLLFAAFLTFVNPVYTNAGAFQDTDQVFKDISDGKLNTGAQEWIKKSNSEEDYEWMKEYFGEDNANKFYNNEYIQSGKAGSPVINDLLGTGVDVVVGTYGGLGGNTPSLGEVIELSWWQKAALGIKDIYGAVKNIFRAFGPSNKEVKEATPGQIGDAIDRDEKKCKITINLSGISFEMKEGNEPNQRPTGFTKSHLSAAVIKKNDLGPYYIELAFTSEGKRLFSEITDRISRSGGTISLYINGSLISSPRVADKIVANTLLVGGEPYTKIEQIIGKQNINNPCPEKDQSTTTQQNTQTSQQPQAQQGKITALVISPDGQPIYQAKFWLVDSRGKLVEKSAGGVAYDAIRYTIQTGNLETLTVPNGQYTLNIDCAANCMFGDKFAQSVVNDIYAKWSKTLPVEVRGSDIWLDKIVLDREK